MRISSGRRHDDPPTDELVVVDIGGRSLLQPPPELLLCEEFLGAERRLERHRYRIVPLAATARKCQRRTPPAPCMATHILTAVETRPPTGSDSPHGRVLR